MASSVQASSRTMSGPVDHQTSIRRGRSKPEGSAPGADYPSALVRALVVPAAFFATNWAAVLLLVTIVGAVPALAAATRTVTDLGTYSDRAFRETLRTGMQLVRRDWIASIALWAFLGLLTGNMLLLSNVAEGGTRVFLAGVLVPAAWVAVALLSAYVAASAALHSKESRKEVAVAALVLVIRRPFRALMAPAVVILLAPVWLLAPLTIAIGLSLPPFVLGRLWGPVPELPPSQPS